MEKWVAAASKVSGRRGRPKGSSRPHTGSGRSKEELANIREWLKKNDHEVNERGRIKSELLDLYDAAHKPE
jgi:hypothetical protein